MPVDVNDVIVLDSKQSQEFNSVLIFINNKNKFKKQYYFTSLLDNLCMVDITVVHSFFCKNFIG